MRVIAEVTVMPRKDVLDPQGQAVGKALRDLGFAEAEGVRIGKLVRLELEASVAELADRAALTERVTQMARRLLSNPVTEDFQVALVGGPKGALP